MKRYFLLKIVVLAWFFCQGISLWASPPGDPVRILTYNVRNCKGLDDVTDYERVAGVIRKVHADVVALQELDSAATRSKKAVVLGELASRTGMHATYCASIPFQGGKYGIGVLTLEKPMSTRRFPLPGTEESRSLLVVELKEVVIFCTHLSLTRKDRDSSLAIITRLSAEYNKPVILAGDMNARPDSPEIREAGKSWHFLNNPEENTFPANNPNECIDYIMARNDTPWVVRVLNHAVVDEKVASDHRPVWVEVQITR